MCLVFVYPQRLNKASMGPCLFRHGYLARTASIALETPKLQWGHALSGMDTMSSQCAGQIGSKLQWGHALSGMDTLGLPYEPRPWSLLQWGHALSGMDTSAGFGRQSDVAPGFNGAMPFQAWICSFFFEHRQYFFSFNGAMPFQAWISQNS